MMETRTVTVDLPESLYHRFAQIAQITQHPLYEVLLHALQVGSPPSWDDAPAEFQVELAALDRLSDEALWSIVPSRKTDADMRPYQVLLDRNANVTLTHTERRELEALRLEADRFLLRKAHAAAILKWRGHQVPPPESLPEVG